MSQPPAYSRAYSFTNFQAANPTSPIPGSQVDLELNNAKRTLDAVLANLALIQRDDGALANASVGLDQLKAEVPVGFNAPVVWTTATAFTAGSSTVFNGSGFYRCLVTHTSGVFATDLAALKWQLIVDLSAVPLVNASQIAVTPSGILTSNAQTSLQALDTGKAATSHTHPSSAISDSTAAGRAMLVAANVAAQQSLLGLGSLAFLSSVNVTTIGANLAFTPSITGALVASANDWTPTGWATAAIVKLTTPGTISISGMAATTDGDIKVIHNTSAFQVTFLFENASSAAANRIAGPTLPNLFQLPAGNSVAFMYDGTASRWRVLSPIGAVPVSTKQVFTTGTSLTYTTPATCRRIRIRMVGGGGGGGGANNSSASTAGGASTFSGGTLSAGGGGSASAIAAGGVGGSASGGNILNIPGGAGQGPAGSSNNNGGQGGGSFFGGNGAGGLGNAAGGGAALNSGGGGGGGGANGAVPSGGGGGAGGYVEHIINNPAATYTYSVGAGGAGATGTTGGAGGAGAAGGIVVEEDY